MGTLEMIYNLFVAYDLIPPGQKYDAVQAQIRKLGPRWYKLQYSLYYVQTELDSRTAHDFVRLAMDSTDKLTVIEARAAYVSNVPIGDLATLQAIFAEGPAYIPA
jgi:hypothetical protein